MTMGILRSIPMPRLRLKGAGTALAYKKVYKRAPLGRLLGWGFGYTKRWGKGWYIRKGT